MSDPREMLKEAIRELLRERDAGKTICPSEAARRAFPSDWRRHMEDCRTVALELSRTGEIEILQRGEPVDPDRIRGPVRVGKRPQ